MASIPPSIGRVPNSLVSLLTTRNINSTQTQLLREQIGLSTGLRVQRPSDDAVASSVIGAIDRDLETASQRDRNMSHAAALLGNIDASLAEINEGLLEAKGIAASQIGVGSDESTRRSQAQVVDAIIDGMVGQLNSSFADVHLFAGGRTGEEPIERIGTGFRYRGEGQGLFTDLGPGIRFPSTIGADSAIGALSSRVKGDVDLNPQLTMGTLVRDIRGPMGPDPELGSLQVTIDSGTPPATTVSVDVSGAETVADVAYAIEAAIRDSDPAALSGGFPSSMTTSGERLSLANIAAGYTITFNDASAGTTAQALGLDGFAFTQATPTSTVPNTELDPLVTEFTTLAQLNPASPVVAGDIVFRNGGAQGTVSVNPGMTVGELKEAIARLDLGIRLEVDESGDSFNVINELSGSKMSIEESGSLAATSLGIRTLSGTTALSVFNDGRGVVIADGETDPTTGLPDPNRNIDFEITMTDGTVVPVDLVPGDLDSVDDLLARINFEAAVVGAGATFTARLAANGNGIEFEDTSGGAGQLSIESLNGFAAEDLGLLDGASSGGPPATIVSSDRATVRVDSTLSTLIELRDALLANDEIGIELAGERLESDLDHVIRARGLVGARASRLEDSQERLQDVTLLNQEIKSSLQDLDYVEASVRFSTLQAQLQAAQQTTVTISQLTLLNFLG